MRPMIVGVDEVGRGCWAGPVVAAAVMLQADITGIDDSKRLSPSRREQLAAQIQEFAFVGVGWASAGYVDKYGLSNAVRKAMQEAISFIQQPYSEVIVDGNINYLSMIHNTRCVISADQTVPAVSAASIIAKVARDSYMKRQSKRFPGYGFDAHVGYGTQRHKDAIVKYGICRLHRRSVRPVKQLGLV